MGTKFLRREAALKCPVHTLIRDKATSHLSLHGSFSREEILTETSMKAMEESIRWDYIREFIQEEQRCELIPVSALFFAHPKSKERKASPIDLKPEKYLASGHGKRTAGYASVTPDGNAGLVLKRLEQRRGIKNGVADALDKFIAEVRAKASRPVLENLDDALSKPSRGRAKQTT